jgi:hypothetical protein
MSEKLTINDLRFYNLKQNRLSALNTPKKVRLKAGKSTLNDRKVAAAVAKKFNQDSVKNLTKNSLQFINNFHNKFKELENKLNQQKAAVIKSPKLIQNYVHYVEEPRTGTKFYTFLPELKEDIYLKASNTLKAADLANIVSPENHKTLADYKPVGRRISEEKFLTASAYKFTHEKDNLSLLRLLEMKPALIRPELVTVAALNKNWGACRMILDRKPDLIDIIIKRKVSSESGKNLQKLVSKINLQPASNFKQIIEDLNEDLDYILPIRNSKHLEDLEQARNYLEEYNSACKTKDKDEQFLKLLYLSIHKNNPDYDPTETLPALQILIDEAKIPETLQNYH